MGVDMSLEIGYGNLVISRGDRPVAPTEGIEILIKYWIPGQARNDRLHMTYVAMSCIVAKLG